MKDSLENYLITALCHQNSHEWLVHFAAHMGMSFLVTTAFSTMISSATRAIVLAWILGLVYKILEGPLWYPGFGAAICLVVSYPVW